ncbi:MAG TPA: hypothetical protein VJN93_15400 [Candidatus Acidoferrum sp.]|nr:hypothetical protein [Candidatus Acidoferrum sp.]
MRSLLNSAYKRIFIGLMCFAASSACVHAQTWTWKYETVDTSTLFTSVAVDDIGNVHLAYAGTRGSSMDYAFRDVSSGHWYTMNLEKQLQEHAVDLTLDAKGNPHICYTPRELKYAYFNGKQWNIQKIAEGEGSIEYNCTLVLSPDGTPHVLWYQTRLADGSNYYHLRYAELLNGAWLAWTVDYDREAGKWNAMVLDAKGNPHIFYSAFPPGDLKSGIWDGKKWDIDVKFSPEPSLSSGMGIAVVRMPDGDEYISFYESPLDATRSTATGSLKFARLTSKGWSVENVDSLVQGGSWVGYRSSLVLDKDGHPHISYEDHGILKHAYYDGKVWHIQVVAPRAIEQYLYSSMAISKDNVLYISYRDPSDGSLKVAIGHESAAAATPATVAKSSGK